MVLSQSCCTAVSHSSLSSVSLSKLLSDSMSLPVPPLSSSLSTDIGLVNHVEPLLLVRILVRCNIHLIYERVGRNTPHVTCRVSSEFPLSSHTISIPLHVNEVDFTICMALANEASIQDSQKKPHNSLLLLCLIASTYPF